MYLSLLKCVATIIGIKKKKLTASSDWNVILFTTPSHLSHSGLLDRKYNYFFYMASGGLYSFKTHFIMLFIDTTSFILIHNGFNLVHHPERKQKKISLLRDLNPGPSTPNGFELTPENIAKEYKKIFYRDKKCVCTTSTC